MPSRWSAVPNSSRKSRRSCAMPSGPGDATAAAIAALAAAERLPRAPGEPSSDLDRCLQHLGRRDHAVGDAEAEGLVGPHETPRVHEVTSTPRADQMRESLRASRPRDHPELDLGLPHGRVVCQETQVRPERELEPPTEREAVDRRDRDRGDLLEQVAGRAERVDARTHLVGTPLGHRLDVGAGGEDAFAAPQHERADVVAPCGVAGSPPGAPLRAADRSRSPVGGPCGSPRRRRPPRG